MITTKKIHRSHKIRLRPTDEQQEHLFRACAAARHAYNWGVAILNVQFDARRQFYRHTGLRVPGSYPDPVYVLKKSYNQIKPDWVKTANGTATQEAFGNLKQALSRYWDIKKGKIRVPAPKKRKFRDTGWPGFRNYKTHNSFKCTNASVKIDGKFIRYNRLVGPIRMCEEPRFQGKFMSATFSWDGLWWYASLQYEIEITIPDPKPEAVGVDLGIKYLAVTSDGEIFENPKAFAKAKAKLRRLQRRLDRQRRANNPDNYNEDGTVKKGRLTWETSNRMKQTEREVLRLHRRIRNIRENASHHLSRSVASNYGVVCIEDLNVSGMVKNGKLAKAVSDAAFFEKRRQLEYKIEENGGDLVVIDQWFPSSKMCNNCGWINAELTLSQRSWSCAECGQENHRDGNAAANIRDEGLRTL